MLRSRREVRGRGLRQREGRLRHQGRRPGVRRWLLQIGVPRSQGADPALQSPRRAPTRAHQTDEIAITGIVERIGTGDAFAAGVIDGWLDGGDPQAMAERGLALAALKHTIPGDMCLIGRAELEAFSAGGGDVRR